MLTRRAWLASGLTLTAQAPRRQPNIIVIYTDDQGLGDLGCYGARDVRTPHLDRLAARGVRFTSLYSNSPVCSPSRCALLTGQYPARHKIMNFLPARATLDVEGLKPGAVTMAGELRKAGYRTAIVGKWHLGSKPESRPMQHGFDEQFGYYSGWVDWYSHRYYYLSRGGPGDDHIFHDLWRNGQPVMHDQEYATELFNREAKAFIERQPKNKPFFLYLAHGAPHYPMIAPQKYLDRFPANMDPDRKMHAAMIAAVDDGVGEILDTLKRRGLDRDTIIYFQADNGATLETRADSQGRPYQGGSNAPFRGFKGGLFEGGIRVPAMLSWPGKVAPNTVIDTPCQTFDLLPTLFDWAGATKPAGLDGASLAAQFARGENNERDLFWEYQGQLAIRRGDWKLMLKPKLAHMEKMLAEKWLSNLKEDPAEQRNWLTENPSVAAELEAKLRTWAQSLGL